MILISYCSYGQDTIRLIRKKPSLVFELANPKHKKLIKIGPPYDPFIELRDSIPDGEYLIYTNDILSSRRFIKNFKKDSVSISYFKNGKTAVELNYKNGLLHGYSKRYYEDGSIREESTFKNGKRCCGYFKEYYNSGKLKTISKADGSLSYLRTTYHENQRLKMREFIVNSNHVRVEYFNEKGELTVAENKHSAYVKFINSKTSFTNGFFDGKTIFRYDMGRFELNYKTGNLLNWKFYDEKNNLIIEENL